VELRRRDGGDTRGQWCCGSARARLKVAGKAGDVVQVDRVLTDSQREGNVERLIFRREGNFLHVAGGGGWRDRPRTFETADDDRRDVRWTEGEK
jgi:hypothetical protein